MSRLLYAHMYALARAPRRARGDTFSRLRLTSFTSERSARASAERDRECRNVWLRVWLRCVARGEGTVRLAHMVAHTLRVDRVARSAEHTVTAILQ
mmetsp:Transcript_43497/g.98326  ORF Transcript_43497/g.98326 Transcript_43497/m.98326 type:complete len:96 (+) Transcript_43497:148-435(+)